MITLILGPGETLQQHQEAAWRQASSPEGHRWPEDRTPRQHQEAAWQRASSPEVTASLKMGHRDSSRRRPGGGRPAQRPPLAWGWALYMLHTWTRWLGSRKIRARGRLETESTEARGTSRRQQSVPPDSPEQQPWLFHSHSDGLLLPISADLGCFLHPSDPLQAPWETSFFPVHAGTPCVVYASGLWGICFLILIFIINYSLFLLHLLIWLWPEIPLGIKLVPRPRSLTSSPAARKPLFWGLNSPWAISYPCINLSVLAL